MGMGHGSSEGVQVEWQFVQLSLLALATYFATQPETEIDIQVA